MIGGVLGVDTGGGGVAGLPSVPATGRPVPEGWVRAALPVVVGATVALRRGFVGSVSGLQPLAARLSNVIPVPR